jgi:hypothetical protein
MGLALGAGVAMLGAPVTAAAQGVTDFFSQLTDNTSVELEGRVIGYPDDPEGRSADDDPVNVSPRVTLSTQGDLTDALSFNTEIYAAYSNQSDEYSGAFREPGSEARQPKFIDFNTVFLRYDADDFGVTVGKERIELGKAEIYSPTNRFGLVDGVMPPDARDFGVWQIGVDYFIEDDTLSLIVTPVHEKGLIPPGSSRWIGTSGDADFESVTLPIGGFGIPGTTVTDEFHSTSPENFGYLLRYEGQREGFDFFGLVHHGPSIFPVLRLPAPLMPVFEKIDPLATSAGGGISVVHEAWKFYGEAIFQFTDESEDQDFVRYVAGVSYRDTEFANKMGIDEIKPILEYAGDEVFDQQGATGFVVNSRNARPFRNTVIARIEVQFNDEWSSALGGTINVGDDDWSTTLGVEYRPNDNLTLQLIGSVFDGTDSTHFGRWQNNDFVGFKVSYKL